MAQPPGYTPVTDFSSEEASAVAGRSTVRTAALDAEFSNVEITLDATLHNLALFQRDDERMADSIVEIHTLHPDVLALMGSGSWVIRGGWLTATGYALGDVVTQSGFLYLCVVVHTSGTFSTDLAAGKWGQLTIGASAIGTSFTATSTIASTNVQNAIEELDTELRPTVNFLQLQFFSAL